MRERERQHEQRQQPAGAPAGDNLGAIGDAVGRLLSAGDAAIERALSGDSDAFLRANRQRGGQ